MFTYLEEDKILFPGDLFGSHMTSSELFVRDEAKVYFAAKRYFAEIMMPFRTNIQKHMGMLNNYELEIIAPTHGQVYDNPEFILEQYNEWISDKVENKVLIPYISMHGSVEKMVNYLTEKLTEHEIAVIPFNMSVTDIGEFAMELVDAATVVIGSSTVHVGPHPKMIYATYLTNMLRPKAKFASIIGSYGWGSRMVDMLKEILKNFKGELLEPVICKGYPKEADFKALDELAEKLLLNIKIFNNHGGTKMNIFDVTEIYQFAVQIEENGEKFYRAMVEKFDDPKVKKLFGFLAVEEVRHEKYLKRC